MLRPILSHELYMHLKDWMGLPDNARRITITMDIWQPSIVTVESDLVGAFDDEWAMDRQMYRLVRIDEDNGAPDTATDATMHEGE